MFNKIHPVENSWPKVGRNGNNDILLRIYIDNISAVPDSCINILIRMNNPP